MNGHEKRLETPRLRLRPFSPDDGPALYAYLSDVRVVHFEPYAPFTEEQARKEAARRADDPAFWAVCRKDTGTVIGNLYCARGDLDTWELGFVFHADHWKRGFATEAARTIVAEAFGAWNAHRMVAHCHPDNTPSWRLLERLGFRREGHLRKNVYFRADAAGRPLWQDTYEYALLAEEWPRDASDRQDEGFVFTPAARLP